MRVLVTGVRGFVGRHLVPELSRHGHTVYGVTLPGEEPFPPPYGFTCDIRDAESVRQAVRQAAPEACVHLAGIAFVPTGWTNPDLVFSVNLNGTIHLLEALRSEAPGARTLVVTSSEVYGREPSARALTEEAPLNPSNLYAVSKVAADLSSALYARRYGMTVMTARPQNHIGPGQSPNFMSQSFAAQLAAIASGKAPPILRVGNLECLRDFTDVRDVARAYRLLLEGGRAGEAYNIASGKLIPVRTVLDELCGLSGTRPTLQTDPERYRPTDSPPLLSIERIRQRVNWQPEIPLARTLRDIYEAVRMDLAR